jgi:hypothetical protein
MKRSHIAVRWVAAACGILLGSWGCYGAYQKVLSCKYARFIDVLPRFTLIGEVEIWSAIVALLLGAFFLCRFAVKPSRWVEPMTNKRTF